MQSSEKFQPTEEFVKKLTRICAGYTGDSYAVGDLIPPIKLAYAQTTFPSLPKSEQVIALVDATIFGKNDFGLAIGVKGIYWRNGWTTPTKNTTLSWQQFATVSIRYKEGVQHIVEMGEGDAVYVLNVLKGNMVKLLCEIQSLVKHSQSTPTSIAQHSPILFEQPVISSVVSNPPNQFVDELKKICASYSVSAQ